MRKIIHIQKKLRLLFMSNRTHFVYILKCNDGTFYTGYTIDLENRLTMHQTGKGAKYTRGKGPFQLVFTEEYATKSEALKREYLIKQLTRQQKIELIHNQNRGEANDESSTQF